ncbi:MAG TPA: ribose 5-phosphate isomerase B [Pirellulaceae bacterium]|nr:ribose 5-phosphate isomerase B [Pirellulaceae bacterium]
MRISIGSDHRGVEIKGAITTLLASLGHQVSDEGPCDSGQAVDYPDMAATVAGKVSTRDADRGILVCGTGIGMAITANKYPGVRAAVCDSLPLARLSRQHNDVNVLCLSGDLPESGADEHLRHVGQIVQTWLETPFEGGRHARRVDKITHYEQAAIQQGCGRK